MKINIPITLMLFIFNSALSDGKEIQIFPYSTNNSLTNCTHGLLAGVDIVVFKSVVDYSADPDMKIVYFQIRKNKESSYHHLCFLNIKEDCNLYKKDCTCRKRMNHSLEITIRRNASVSYSGASLRGVAIRSYDNLQIRSQEQMFPDIYDFNNTTGHLVTNGNNHDISRNDCVEYISGPDLNVTYVCIGELSPCLIDISASDSTEHVNGREQLTYYRVYNKSQEIIVTVKYAPCSLDRLYHTVSCKINIARIDNFICHSDILYDSIKVTCSAIVFTTTKCGYFINNHDIKEVFQNVTIKENVETLQLTRLAHTTHCGFNLMKSNVNPGLYDVVVVMYPSVDDYDDDIKLGTNKTISIPIMKIGNISCSNDSTGDIVNVTCSAEKMYPQARCRVEIIGKIQEKITIPESNLTVVNELVHNHTTYYASRCTYKINKTTFNPGHYEIIVTIYPNITGTENDFIFGTSWSVVLHIRDSFAYTNDAIDAHAIAYITGGSTLMVLLGVLIGYCKLNGARLNCDSCIPCVEGKVEPGCYDVINQGYILVDDGVYRGNNEYDTSGYVVIESSSPREITKEMDITQQNIYETIDDDVFTPNIVCLCNTQHVKVELNTADHENVTIHGELSNFDWEN